MFSQMNVDVFEIGANTKGKLTKDCTVVTTLCVCFPRRMWTFSKLVKIPRRNSTNIAQSFQHCVCFPRRMWTFSKLVRIPRGNSPNIAQVFQHRVWLLPKIGGRFRNGREYQGETHKTSHVPSILVCVVKEKAVRSHKRWKYQRETNQNSPLTLLMI